MRLYLIWALLALAPAVAHADLVEPLEFDCVVEPSLVLDLGSSVAGLIDDVLVDEGQMVRKGEVVARLRSEVEAARLLQARMRAESDAQIVAQKAALDLASARSNRIARLSDRAVASQAQREEAQAELRTARMNLRLAELQQKLDRIALDEAEITLALRALKSPVDGVVTARNRGPGEHVFQDTHVLTVAQIDPLFARALLPARIYPLISAGTDVELEIGLPEPQRTAARIAVVDKVLNAAAGTFGVRAEISNPQGKIPAGQSCKLLFAPP